MSALLYLAGIISIVVAALLGYQLIDALQSSLGWALAAYQFGAALGGALIFFALARGLDLLAEIADNSDYLSYLERLDPAIAAERDAESDERTERRARPFWRR